MGEQWSYTDELVARLRAANNYEALGKAILDVADALEARGKRIDELESRLVDKEVRIAELEAALKPFSELFLYPDDLGLCATGDIICAEDWDEEENDKVSEEVFVARGDIRKARAALKGEKG